jgi:hypothetical protein
MSQEHLQKGKHTIQTLHARICFGWLCHSTCQYAFLPKYPLHLYWNLRTKHQKVSKNSLEKKKYPGLNREASKTIKNIGN